MGNEPYGSNWHIALNEHPGQPRTTEWLNMGYWKNTNIFPEACQALALLVAEKACQEPGHVLDVGYGCGDSLMLQLMHPSLPRPLSLTGITSLQHQNDSAKRRVPIGNASGAPPIHLYVGDAIFRATSPSSTHPLDPDNPQPPYNSILALDCAYHFDNRETFLRQCYTRLEPSTGRIALADMCFNPPASSPMASMASRLVAFLLSVPKANLVTTVEYEAILNRIGYADVQINDISDAVFPGFTTFLAQRGLIWWLFAWVIHIWWKGGGTFVCVTARKP